MESKLFCCREHLTKPKKSVTIKLEQTFAQNKVKGKLKMGILDSIFSAAFEETVSPFTPNWVEWTHISMGKTHCATCLRLDNCWFTDENKPKLPQHLFCHCTDRPIAFSRVLNEAQAVSAYEKFDPYLFNTNGGYSHGKEKMFVTWGYSVKDAPWLQKELERQALEKYRMGQYHLGKLNEEGQRISIRVQIPRKNSDQTVSFITGWMVHPNGKIRMATPYGMP